MSRSRTTASSKAATGACTPGASNLRNRFGFDRSARPFARAIAFFFESRPLCRACSFEAASTRGDTRRTNSVERNHGVRRASGPTRSASTLGRPQSNQARKGQDEPCVQESEGGESLRTIKPREEKTRVIDQNVFEYELHCLDECRSPSPVPRRPHTSHDRTDQRDDSGPGHVLLTRRVMKLGGLRGAVLERRYRENRGARSWSTPVGGAPSRSGFLTTPIDASSRQGVSRTSHRTPGEEVPCKIRPLQDLRGTRGRSKPSHVRRSGARKERPRSR